MFKPTRLSAVLFATLLTTLGCHAQSPASPASSPAIAAPVVGKPLSPELSRRVEVLLRQKAPLPPGSTIQVGVPTASEVPGFSLISVTFSNEGKSSRPINFLISADGKTLAQFTKFDISADPKNLVSAEGRPARGGPVTAPVLIVGFDDLECPFCARLHESIFPAMINRYGDKVRIVYKDFPLDTIHPWAEHAAVDVNCIGAQSPVGYWNLVDGIHAHASDIGTSDDPKDTQKTLANATAQLDKLTREQGKLQKVDAVKLDACLSKQDTASVDASKAVGVSLGLEEAPTLFINGDKVSGALPVEFIFGIIDDALRAQGLTPPPPYVAPATTASVAGGKS